MVGKVQKEEGEQNRAIGEGRDERKGEGERREEWRGEAVRYEGKLILQRMKEKGTERMRELET